jgi:hypothetical protein
MVNILKKFVVLSYSNRMGKQEKLVNFVWKFFSKYSSNFH